MFAKLDPGPVQHAILCAYSRINCTWQDVPKMHCEDWNPIGAAGALLDGWLYLAGGYKGKPSCECYIMLNFTHCFCYVRLCMWRVRENASSTKNDFFEKFG